MLELGDPRVGEGLLVGVVEGQATRHQRRQLPPQVLNAAPPGTATRDQFLRETDRLHRLAHLFAEARLITQELELLVRLVGDLLPHVCQDLLRRLGIDLSQARQRHEKLLPRVAIL